jgi:hypothetical protein
LGGLHMQWLCRISRCGISAKKTPPHYPNSTQTQQDREI